MRDWAILPLRIGLGILFIAHGLQKAFGSFNGPGIDGFAGTLSKLGLAPSIIFAYIVAYIQLLCGIGLVLGLCTRISSALLMALTVIATISINFKNGFFLVNGGFDFNFIIIVCCLSLLMSGSNKLSITDNL